MRTRIAARTAAVLVGLEALALAALIVWQLAALLRSDTAAIETALALLVLTAIGAAAVMVFAVAIWRDRSWGRSGAIVTQALILAVALGAATGSYADTATALVLAAPAVIALILLVIAVREAGRRASGAASD